MALTSLIPDPNNPTTTTPFSQLMPGGAAPPNAPPQLAAPGLRDLVSPQRSQQEQNLQSRISSYENPQKPQGFWQNVRHIAATIGNVAGDIAAPSEMALIPGTQLHNALLHRQNVGELAGLQKQDTEDSTAASGNALRGATTAHTAEETAEMPQEAAAKDAQSKATTENLTSEATDRDKAQQNPSLAAGYAHAVNQAIKEGRDPATDPIVQHLSDAITSLQPGENKTPEAPKTITAVRPGVQGPHEYGWNPKTSAYDIDEGQHYEKPQVINVNAGERLEREGKNDVLKAYQPTMDSAERMNVMTDAYEKAIKNHDQQAMLNLLANHLGMTMGLQKGARLTKDIVHEAQNSQPWLQGVAAKFDNDGYLSGVTLSPNQMRQMVSLGQERYAEDANKSRSTAQYLGAKDDGPARIPGKSTINYYLGLAGGDAQKAKTLAGQDGWTVGGAK